MIAWHLIVVRLLLFAGEKFQHSFSPFIFSSISSSSFASALFVFAKFELHTAQVVEQKQMDGLAERERERKFNFYFPLFGRRTK